MIIKVLIFDEACSDALYIADGLCQRLLPPAVEFVSACRFPVQPSPLIHRVMNEADMPYLERRPKELGKLPSDFLKVGDCLIVLGRANQPIFLSVEEDLRFYWPLNISHTTSSGDFAALEQLRDLRDKLESRLSLLVRGYLSPRMATPEESSQSGLAEAQH